MRLVSLMLVVMATMIVPSAAYAGPDKKKSKDLITYSSVVERHIKSKSKNTFPRVVLPDVAALTKEAMAMDRKLLPKQRWKSATVLAFYKNPQHRWLLAPNKTKCWEVPWQRTCTIARASVRLHSALAEVATRRLLYELPETGDWVTAVRIAQRPYPGTETRVMAITGHEGGRGPWVWWAGTCSSPPCLWTGHHVGDDPWGDDTVGGWVQFRYSTFIVYYPQMVRDLKRRGFLLPDLGWARPYVVAGASTGYGPWLSPLGQALTVAYMHYYRKQGRHWNF